MPLFVRPMFVWLDDNGPNMEDNNVLKNKGGDDNNEDCTMWLATLGPLCLPFMVHRVFCCFSISYHNHHRSLSFR